MKLVNRYFLETEPKSFQIFGNNQNDLINCEQNKDIQLNKFFYKEIGADHHWRDRLNWSDERWIDYLSNSFLKIFVLKIKKKLAGFYEIEHHENKNEVELIQLGLLREYRGKKYGSLLLKHALNEAKKLNSHRVWVHTCSLDHEYALKNYTSRGFKIFKQERIYINS
tara:strand:- start:11088 stop:11588 length:501 start_codon:yes stop_codon:yes gene_type:complete